jgi:methylated-DNA-[protein]-cysteine S-methyltransferase
MNTEDELTSALNLAFADDPDHLRRLRERLALAADTERILDVAYRTIDSPVGTLLLAATDRGLVRVAYSNEDHDDVLQNLARRISPRILEAPARLEAAARELDEYFLGLRHDFDVPIDWSLSTGFRNTVLRHLPDIQYGHTASYSTVAQLAGNPRAVRAVGTACATNPLPVIIPCHRVVRADGTLGGYLGGIENKRTLLALESAAA